MAKVTLTPVPCPVCKSGVENVSVDADEIQKTKRVPILIPAKCNKGHSVVLFVDKSFTIRDVEAAGEAVQEEDASVDKAMKWMDSF